MDQTNNLAKIILVSTCVAPVLVVYSFIAYTKGQYENAGLFIIVILSLSLVALWYVRYIYKNGQGTTITALSYRAADKEVSGFFVSYLIPLIAANDFFFDVVQGGFFMALFFIFIWASKSYYANPILGIFGYKFYEVTTSTGKTLLLITKKNINHKKEIVHIKYLTQYTVLMTHGE